MKIEISDCTVTMEIIYCDSENVSESGMYTIYSTPISLDEGARMIYGMSGPSYMKHTLTHIHTQYCSILYVSK